MDPNPTPEPPLPPPGEAPSSPLPPPPPPPPAYPVAPPPATGPNQDERLWATIIHLSGIAGSFFTLHFVPGHLIVPLVIWLTKRQGSPYLDDQGKECVNFQISLTLALIPCFLLLFVCIGLPLIIALSAYALVIQIVAAAKANDGGTFRYPFIIRFIS